PRLPYTTLFRSRRANSTLQQKGLPTREWEGPFGCYRLLQREALTGRRVERVHARRVRGDRDDVTGDRVVAAVHTDHDLGVVAVDHGGTVQVTVRTELLNEVHLDLEAALGRRNDREVLGAHAHGDGVTRRALNVMRNRNNSRTDLNA